MKLFFMCVMVFGLITIAASGWAQDRHAPIAPPPDALDKNSHGGLPPNWRREGTTATLIDKDTGLPFVLSRQERDLLVAAMKVIAESENLDFFKSTYEYIKGGGQVRIGDVVFLNRPLMNIQQPKYDLAPEQIEVVKGLRRRLISSAGAMAPR